MTAFGEAAAGRPARLVEAALEFAADEYPDLYVRTELARVDRFRAELRQLADLDPPSDSTADVVLLNRFFFDLCGFRGSGDNYYDPRNSYLNEVLDRRVGIPISLSVLYADLANAMGLDLHGVNLPGHFVLGFFEPDGTRRFIDVFNGGEVLGWEECCGRVHQSGSRRVPLSALDFPPMAPRDVLARMLRNLKGIYAAGDLTRAIRVQKRLVELFADNWAEVNELAELFLAAGRPALALRALKELLRRRPDLESVDVFRESLRKAARDAAHAN